MNVPHERQRLIETIPDLKGFASANGQVSTMSAYPPPDRDRIADMMARAKSFKLSPYAVTFVPRAIRSPEEHMAKLMSKSELIQKIADQSNGLTRKDIKGVIESLASVGYKELKKTGAFFVPDFREICCHQEARHKATERHQSFYKGTNSIQGQAGQEDYQGSAGEGCQRRSRIAKEFAFGAPGSS